MEEDKNEGVQAEYRFIVQVCDATEADCSTVAGYINNKSPWFTGFK